MKVERICSDVVCINGVRFPFRMHYGKARDATQIVNAQLCRLREEK